MSRVIGLDVGDVRTGVAVSDELGWTARPLVTVKTAELARHLPDLLKKYAAEEVVVGRPRLVGGSLGGQAEKVEEILEWLRGELPVKFIYEDETATTAEAADSTDHAAACVMLQGYLDETN